MKQILCLFIIVLLSISIGKAENLDDNLRSSYNISNGAPPTETDTIRVDVTSHSTAVFCVDSLEVVPVGSIAIFNCVQLANSGFAVAIPGTPCVSYEVANTTMVTTDTLCVSVCNSIVPTNCDTTIFIVTITPLPPPQPMEDNVNMMEDDTVEINVLANDIVEGTPSLAIIDSTDNGTVSINPVTNIITYIPDPDYCGLDQFIYWLCNGNCTPAIVNIEVGCSDEKEFLVYNSFSPNGDGFNDTFSIEGLEAFPENKIFIYNRWGILVYSSTPYGNDWDGRWNGEDLPDGTYFYIFDDGNKNIKQGYLQLHR